MTYGHRHDGRCMRLNVNPTGDMALQVEIKRDANTYYRLSERRRDGSSERNGPRNVRRKRHDEGLSCSEHHKKESA